MKSGKGRDPEISTNNDKTQNNTAEVSCMDVLVKLVSAGKDLRERSVS